MLIKKTLFSASILLIATLAMAQKSNPPVEMQETANPPKFYFKVYGGYGFLTPGSFKLNSFSVSNFTVGKTGLGAGLHYGGGAGFVASDFLNFGVDVDYLKGNDLKASSSFSGSGLTFVTNSTITYSILSAIPNVTFKAASKPNYFIYTRIGIIITVNTKSAFIYKDTSNFASGNAATDSGRTFAYNVNVGVQAALGVQFNITNRIRGLVELVGNYLPITPSSSASFTKRRFYDLINAPTGSTSSSSNLTYSKSGNAGAGIQPANSFNVNYIGVNIGIVVRI